MQLNETHLLNRTFKRGVISTLLIAMCLLLIQNGFMAFAEPKEIEWMNSVEDALKKSKETGKPVFVDIFADWCGWCHRLENEVFPHEKISSLLENKFVPLRVDSDANPSFSNKYGVTGLPTLLVLRADGTALKKISGYQPVDELHQILTSTLEAVNNKEDLTQLVAREPKNASAHYRLGIAAAQLNEPTVATQHLGKALELDEQGEKIERETTLFTLARIHASMGQLDQSLGYIDTLIGKYPDSENYYSAHFLRGMALLEKEDETQARESLKKVIDAPEDSVPRGMKQHCERVLAYLDSQQPAQTE